MTELEMEDALYDCFSDLIFAADEGEFPEELPKELAEIDSVQTFAEAGLLTRNNGIVLRMKDGSEHQIAIKRSR